MDMLRSISKSTSIADELGGRLKKDMLSKGLCWRERRMLSIRCAVLEVVWILISDGVSVFGTF
jgi:hypothetical protein